MKHDGVKVKIVAGIHKGKRGILIVANRMEKMYERFVKGEE